MLSDLSEAQERARRRLGKGTTRRRRSDAGRSRLRAELLAEFRRLVLASERPSMTAIQRRLAHFATRQGWRPPSRGALYGALACIDGTFHQKARLPAAVQEALYNLDASARVPGHQLAFYCFNYGSVAAASFAAGLAWLDLYQAARLRGWRPRSRGLLLAALAARSSPELP